MFDTLLIYAGKLNAVYAEYEDLHTTMADSSMPQPSGFERSSPAAASKDGPHAIGSTHCCFAAGKGAWTLAGRNGHAWMLYSSAADAWEGMSDHWERDSYGPARSTDTAIRDPRQTPLEDLRGHTNVLQ